MRTMHNRMMGLALMIAAFAMSAAAQNTFPASGNVGIGTTNPQNALDLGDGTGGRSIVWAGGTGQGWYDTIGTSYSSASLNMLTGLKLSGSIDQTLFSWTGSYAVWGHPSRPLQRLNKLL